MAKIWREKSNVMVRLIDEGDGPTLVVVDEDGDAWFYLATVKDGPDGIFLVLYRGLEDAEGIEASADGYISVVTEDD